ncbi:FdhF/YdeP family oxidoreductase [Fictibacillus sp. KU28468]|uniref:FdhF/YdeP family oxidoreductase n=1 Tax=Fictibacillus sp. KU28468 TaxID=2991053 RepID=UPI00223CF4DB|nr:FdhF/YdeP family oxidoreductase [Fictibacillus sp. KU28468]UZJ77548.1 FdhF/YdeP family oxidoreductase [Fictibacillus sp. KU28468]
MGNTKHTGPVSLPLKPDPSLWASPVPFGFGKNKPHHVRDTLKAAWENRDNLKYAAKILNEGVCDGCALGVSGLRDQTLSGMHLCTTRLNVLRLNTMPAIPEKMLHDDIQNLKKYSSSELRQLGRIPYPLIRKKGDQHFRRITWDEALNTIATKIKAISPKQLAFYLTSRGITNESYYIAAKAARFIGTNNIDNASRICHSPSKTALNRMLGIGASSCSYKDWIGTGVLVFWGSVSANNQPVTTKYIYAAKRKGTKVIIINPYAEPSMERYWIPSIPDSAVFGTKIADDFYQVKIGGDIALINGIIKHWFEMERKERGSALEHSFINEHVKGLEEMKRHVRGLTWENLEKSSGIGRERICELAEILACSKSGVFVWSMGLTQHRFGTDNVSQIVNLALLRGFLGRENCGLMPIRGHSGVQGAGEMGADPFSLPGGGFDERTRQRVQSVWGFAIPDWQGDILGISLENALLTEDADRKLKLYYMSGGNFLETMPDPDFVKSCLENIEVRVHQDIILNTSTLLDARDCVIVLPAMTRYEQPGGGTSTSTERMVYFSPEINGPRMEEARPEWEIYSELASRVWPDQRNIMQFSDAEAVRKEIAMAAPNYKGIQDLCKKGDVFQWGGAWLCEGGICPTENGRGRLFAIDLPEQRQGKGEFTITTRRGKQFNSMVYHKTDPFNQASREDVLLHLKDVLELGLREGESVVVYNRHGLFRGRVKIADIKRRNAALYWPEANCLIPKGVYERSAGIPEYNSGALIEKAEVFYAQKDKAYKEKRLAESELDDD